MSFINGNYFIYIIVVYILIIGIFYKINIGYFRWIKSYWFFDQSILNKISNFFYGIALFLFLLALLDLRGPETKVRTNLPDQKTIIVLDSSLSMLCEDVRPSRFVKSIQIARHFVKGAAGHQIAIVIFSDLQKRLIPFTDDIDLIDSRLAALEKSNTVSGGTNIGQAITEAASYFESDNMNEEKGGGGNILVFTDAEEGEDNFKVDLPNNINLALVGVGTAKGGNIPIRWEDGSFKGYKTVKNEMVVTRLDENFIKSIGKDVKNFKFWIANSYSLPTEEIMDFFRATYNQKHSSGDLRVRPVFSHYILIPAILIYCLGVFFGRFNSFRTIQSIVLLCFLSSGLYAQEPKELSPEIKKDLGHIKEGKASRSEVLKTAEKLLKAKEDQKAAALYSEYSSTKDEEAVRFNHATSLLKSGKTKEAMPIIQDLMNNSKNEELKNKMRSNLANAIKRQKEKKEKQDNKDNKDNKEDKKDQDKKENKENKEKKDEKKNQKPGQDKEDKKDKSASGKNEKQDNKSNGKDEDKKEDKKKDEKKDNKKDDKKDGEGDQKKEEEKPQTLEQKEKEIEQKRRMTKTPGMIKQIMNDDRELQKKLMDTTTKEKGELKPKRDW